MSDTPASAAQVGAEIASYEPILHRDEYHGWSREQLATLLAPEFFEIASTGFRYARDEVLDTITAYHATPQQAGAVDGLEVVEVAPDVWFARYTLRQPGRVTLRATLWRRAGDGWAALFHQGTLAAS